MAGYRSYTAIAEWIADVPTATALALGIAPDRRPHVNGEFLVAAAEVLHECVSGDDDLCCLVRS